MATYLKQVDEACFAKYDQASNPPLPWYGFVSLSSIRFTVVIVQCYLFSDGVEACRRSRAELSRRSVVTIWYMVCRCISQFGIRFIDLI